MERNITTVVSGLSFTECPRWHGGRLWFSDFYTQQVYSIKSDGSDLKVELSVPAQPSGLGWLPDGRLLVVSMRDRKIMRREGNGELVVHADIAAHVTGHPNDMIVDRHGRAYVGNFGFDLMGGGAIAPTVLLRVDMDGSVHTAADEMWFPNGMVITSSNTLVVNETLGNRMSAFDIAADGNLINRRTFAKFGELPDFVDVGTALQQGQIAVAPDGNCIDAEDAVWIADAIGGRVMRVREGGEVTDEIRPGTGVFACGLGGESGRTLYMCCAPDFYEHARSVVREGEIRATEVGIGAP